MDDCILVTNERIYQLRLIYFVFCSKNNNIKVFTPNIVCNGFLVLVRVFSNDEWFQKPYGWLYLGHKRKNMLSFVSEREFWVDNPVERCVLVTKKAANINMDCLDVLRQITQV